jgi:hypothetical protein
MRDQTLEKLASYEASTTMAEVRKQVKTENLG